MKKFVKPLVIAASVAAIAGIGAVSFAAWSEGTSTDANVAGTTGTITTLGSVTATSNIHGTGALALVPYNQVDQFDSTKMTKMADIALAYGTDNNATGVDIKIALSSNDDNLTLLYKLGTAETVPSDTTGWTAIPTTATAITVTPGTTHVYVILDSNDTKDMGKSFTITFSTEVASA